VVAGLIAALLRPVALPPGRCAAGVLCVRGGEMLANATICRFCGCFCCRWGEVLGGTNGWQSCSRGRLFDPQQYVIRQSSFYEGAPRVSWSSSWGQL